MPISLSPILSILLLLLLAIIIMMSVGSTKHLATPKSPAFLADQFFSLDDDDDDELLLLPLPPPRKAVNSKDSVKATGSKLASGKLGAEQYLEQLEKELQEECRQLFNSPSSSASRNSLSIKKQAPPSDSFDDNHYTVYYHCPVCLVPGHQSATKTGFTIAHIKGCAQKAGLGPREVISRLRSCPQRQRLKPKKVERPQKKSGKPGRTKKSPSNLSSFEKRDCQLTQSPDLSHQAKHLGDRVASVLNPGKLAFSVGALDPYLPPRWLAARLDSPPETYYVPGFEKYFNFATAASAKEAAELEQARAAAAAKLN